MSRTGELSLPDRYQPARLTIPASENERVTLRLGASFVEFPECIARYFRRVPRRHVKLSASWYHDPSEMPYYLSIHLEEKRSKIGAFDGWSLLIDLDTVRLLTFSRESHTDGGYGRQGTEIPASTICTPDEQAQLTPRIMK